MTESEHQHHHEGHHGHPAHRAGPGEAAGAASATQAPDGAVYTCPMHPQIRQPAPGSCPICGMALEPVMPAVDDGENPELVDFRRRFWWTLPLTVVVFALAMFGHMVWGSSLPGQNWIEFAVGTPVVVWAGWPFYVRWARSIANASPNMWSLICLLYTSPSPRDRTRSRMPSSA